MFRLSPTNIAWLVAYVLMLLVITVGMRSYRANAMSKYGTASAGEKWQDWRNAAKEMGGPVQRRAPASNEPPPLVLMRDHFAACLGISLLLSSCLFVWFMFSVRGAFRPVVIHTDD